VRLTQAIFTSTKGSRLDGYQLAGRSPGVSEAIAKELTTWGPAHDSLWDTRQDARSVNFHPLSTGDYCLSCTTVGGAEYSGRGGWRIYTQMFLLPAEALTRFAEIEPQKAELVKLRYFWGLTIEEAADAMGISPATAKRHWAFSKAWLLHAIRGTSEKSKNP
jgi:hypothetical protein